MSESYIPEIVSKEYASKNESVLGRHDELLKNPIFREVKETMENLREKEGELGKLLKEKNLPEEESLSENIFGNPEIFALFEFLRKHGEESSQLYHILNIIEENEGIDYGATVLMGGAGWGIDARNLQELRPDVHITMMDINSKLLEMANSANREQGFDIDCVTGDIVSKEAIKEAMRGDSPDLVSTGLIRYLTKEQLEQMVENLQELAKPGTRVIMHEINPPAINALTEILEEKDIPHEKHVKEDEFLRFTLTYAYYYLLNKKEPITSAIMELNPNFDLDAFTKLVEKEKENYPEINAGKLIGKEYEDLGDLRSLLVLSDLAGRDTKKEEAIIFKF